MNITREQALCMLFYKEFNKENVDQCQQEISHLSGKFQVCYQIDPKQPILVSEMRIFADPASYRLYPEVATTDPLKLFVKKECVFCKEIPREPSGDAILTNVVNDRLKEIPKKMFPKEQDCRLKTNAEALAFLNLTITKTPRHYQFYNPGVYQTYGDILTFLRKYTAVFDLATEVDFMEWCKKYQPACTSPFHSGEGVTCYIMKKEYVNVRLYCNIQEKATDRDVLHNVSEIKLPTI
ncbi:hypothetical protein MBANPS3_006243 [Mucor bainieri]